MTRRLCLGQRFVHHRSQVPCHLFPEFDVWSEVVGIFPTHPAAVECLDERIFHHGYDLAHSDRRRLFLFFAAKIVDRLVPYPIKGGADKDKPNKEIQENLGRRSFVNNIVVPQMTTCNLLGTLLRSIDYSETLSLRNHPLETQRWKKKMFLCRRLAGIHRFHRRKVEIPYDVAVLRFEPILSVGKCTRVLRHELLAVLRIPH
jgi:hypothetical protein